MAVKQGPYIFINSENLAEADFMSRGFVNKEIRNRAFINTLGAEALIKYLTTENVNLKNIRNIHSVARILEYADIADIMMPNIHIDVRVVFDENQIFIPKSHFEYEIQPDIYVVLKLGENFEYFELMGFFEPRSINMSHENSQYYFYENYKLSSPGHLVKFIKTYARRAPESITEEELLKGRELSVNLADHDITESEFKTLLKLMVGSAELRDSILEYDNFETLSHRVAPLMDDGTVITQPVIETPSETVVDTELEDETDEDSVSDEEQPPEEELSENDEESGETEEYEDDTEETAEEEAETEIYTLEEETTAEAEAAEEEEVESEENTEVETEAEETAEELFGQDLTFDTENLDDINSETETEEVLQPVEDIDITDAEEAGEDEQSEANESIDNTASENIVTTEENDDDDEGETLDFDSPLFERDEDEVLELTDDFFTEDINTPPEEPEQADESHKSDDDGNNFVSDILKTGLETASGVAETAAAGTAAAAGVQLAAGAAASTEAINLAAVAGSEISDLADDNIDDIFDEPRVSEEINNTDETELEDLEIGDLEIEENPQEHEDIDTDFDEDLITDETGADTADLGDLVETFDDLPLNTETTVNFDELETTADISQDTQIHEEETVNFENFEDLSVVSQDVPETGSVDLTEHFTDFDSINEISQTQEPVRDEIIDEAHDFETLVQMPETTNVISDTSAADGEVAEEAVSFEDLSNLGSETDIPAEINSEIEADAEVLQDMPSFENQENNQNYSYEQEDELNSAQEDVEEIQSDLPDENLQETYTDENTEDFSPFEDVTPEIDDTDNNEYTEDTEETEEEETQPQDTFGIAAGEDWEADNDEFVSQQSADEQTSEDDFSFEEFGTEPEITDEDVPQQITQEASENSAPISNAEFNPGEIPIDINNDELTYDEAEHLESIYNDSSNFQNSALNNSARFVRGGSASQNGQSKLFAITAGLLVLVLVGVLGMSAFKMFKPSAQNEPQPVTDGQFPEIPQSMGTEDSPIVDTSKVVTMNNTNPAPVAQPAISPQTSSPAANKIPATSFLEISKLSWEVPDYISANANFKRYFQSAGKSLKAGLSSDLLLAKDYIYSKQMRLSVTFDKNGSFKESRMLMSSGSTQIDNIVLQSVNQTLSVLKAPNSLGNDQSTTVILKIYF